MLKNIAASWTENDDTLERKEDNNATPWANDIFAAN